MRALKLSLDTRSFSSFFQPPPCRRKAFSRFSLSPQSSSPFRKSAQTTEVKPNRNMVLPVCSSRKVRMESKSSFMWSLRAKERPRENIEKPLMPAVRAEKDNLSSTVFGLSITNMGKRLGPKCSAKHWLSAKVWRLEVSRSRKILEWLPDVPDDRIIL